MNYWFYVDFFTEISIQKQKLHFIYRNDIAIVLPFPLIKKSLDVVYQKVNSH